MESERSILLPDGKRMHVVRLKHESQDEFSGRVLGMIEERITGKRGPTPKGTRWCEWWHSGHPLRQFHANGLGTVRESTGNPYADRTVIVAGIYDEKEAREAIKRTGAA